MSFGLLLGQLANGYNGYTKGEAQEVERQHTLEKNAMDKERWAQEKEEFALKREEAARARAERQGIAGAKTAGAITEESDDAPDAPVPVKPATPTAAVSPAPAVAPSPAATQTTALPKADAVAPAAATSAAPAPIAAPAADATALPTQPVAPAVQAAAPTAPAAPKASRFKVGGLYFKTREEAQSASTDAVNAATAQAMRDNGNIRGAMDFETSLRNAKVSDMSYKKAVQADKDDQFNRAFDDEVLKSGNSFDAVAGILTKTGMHGLDGVKVEARKSDDGKKISLVAIGPNGEHPIETYDNSTAGQEAVRKRFMKADPATRTAWMEEKKKEELAADDRTWSRGIKEREVGAQENHYKSILKNAEAQLAISGGHLNIAAAEEKRKVEAWKQEQKIPGPVKAAYAAKEQEAKTLDTEMTRGQVNGIWDPNTPAAKELIKRRANISADMADLLSPYIEKANDASKVNPASSDPAGVRTPAPAAAPAATPAPAKKKMTAADLHAAATGIPK
jgi:hypothetical protein